MGALKMKSKATEDETSYYPVHLFGRADEFKTLITNIKNKHEDIDIVVIEEPLANTVVNINTTATLLRFNGMVSMLVYEILGVMPHYISSLDARRYGFPEISVVRRFDKKGDLYDRDKILKDIKKNAAVPFGDHPWDVDKKKVIWDCIDKRLPNLPWAVNRTGGFDKTNYDTSDSIALIAGYVNMVENGFGGSKPKVALKKNDIHGVEYAVSFCGEEFCCQIDFC